MPTAAEPYAEFRDSRFWSVVEESIEDLVANDDLLEKTSRAHIVGYIVSKLESLERGGDPETDAC